MQRILPRWKILYSDSAFQWVETVTLQKLTKYGGGWQWSAVLRVRFRLSSYGNDQHQFVPRDQERFSYLPFAVHYVHKKMYSFTPISSIRICLAQFLSAYFLFWKREIFNLNLTMAVCRKHDSSSWFRFQWWYIIWLRDAVVM